MKSFHCECGHSLFFDSTKCVNCGREIAFDPQTFSMQLLGEAQRDDRTLCLNGREYHACNWLQAASDRVFCIACDLNRTIPNLSIGKNLDRWRILEAEKKRLVYNLLRLRLPVVSRHQSPVGLCFDFLEDSRSDPSSYAHEFHYTGYADGIITINLLEADPAAREATREAMNEQYRTVLGHMRHESGHYYLELLEHSIDSEKFKRLFGDISLDYSEALERYYRAGPPLDWETTYISAYASAHPLEDWAETWAHYLHLSDALETATAHGLVENINQFDFRARLGRWRELSVTLNELNRGFGVSDAYPFTISAKAEAKIVFVDDLIKSLRIPQTYPGDC